MKDGIEEAVLVIAITFAGGVLVGLITYLVVYALYKEAPQENTTRVHTTVKAVCKEAQSNLSLMDACYTAQTASNTEYICLDNNCEVEDK